MKKKYTINFAEASEPINEAVTKFGGQPVWIGKPEWAISETTGNPMMFIGQIALDKEIFGETETKMAYLFIEDEDPMSETWDANSGDNAVIIQPDGNNPPTVQIETGKTLYQMKAVENEKLLQPFECEFRVEKTALELDKKDSEDGEFENKVGGFPHFLQGEEYPDGAKENWNLLLQLDSATVPFSLNFGDAGIGYAFISKDGKTGKFLWQCS